VKVDPIGKITISVRNFGMGQIDTKDLTMQTLGQHRRRTERKRRAGDPMALAARHSTTRKYRRNTSLDLQRLTRGSRRGHHLAWSNQASRFFP